LQGQGGALSLLFFGGKGDYIILLQITSNRKNIKENRDAANVELTVDDL